jgi:hypothetical protein
VGNDGGLEKIIRSGGGFCQNEDCHIAENRVKGVAETYRYGIVILSSQFFS